MKYALLLSLFAASTLMGGSLTLTNGSVKAHTEVFGDSTIDPMTTGITSHLTISQGIESIKGSVNISLKALKSDNEERDEHMFETIESGKYPLATYTFQEVTKAGTGYQINGILDFHGVKKPLTVTAAITEEKGHISLKGKSAFMMSDFGVKPPKLLFLTVRDQIDLTIDVTFKRR